MKFSEVQPFFKKYVLWQNEYDLFWYEVMWNELANHELVKSERKEDQLKSYLFASSLVHFYRSFAEYCADEYWSEDQLSCDEMLNLSKQDFRDFLRVPTMTIRELVEKEGEWVLDESVEHLNDLLLESELQYSDIFYEYAYDDYYHVVLQTLKKKYKRSDMFALLSNTLLSDRYTYADRLNDSDEEMEQKINTNIQDITSFIETAQHNEDYFTSDMDLIRGYEWLSAVY